jgi:hypothetical protein
MSSTVVADCPRCLVIGELAKRASVPMNLRCYSSIFAQAVLSTRCS